MHDGEEHQEARSPNPAQSQDLKKHYVNYFSRAGQLEWYALMAVDKAANIVSVCRDVPHDSIIEIGAGDGAVLHRLQEMGFGERLHAVDISESGVAALQEKQWTRLVRASLYDGYSVPYPDQSFDLAILSHVIEHVEHPRLLLREASRVARHVYVEVPLEVNLSNRGLKRDFVLTETGHINFYNPDLIRILIQSTGLTLVRQQIHHFTPEAYLRARGRRGWINYWIKESLHRLSPHLAAKFFNYHCSNLCRREDGAVRPRIEELRATSMCGRG